MPIQDGDIVLLASQVMTDDPEGGGPPTSTVIAHGAMHSIFPVISELESTTGRVRIRKVFMAVMTDDTDTYYGANVIVETAPTDPNVSITLMSTGDAFDRRDAARNRIEAYLAPGPEWAGYLLENHVMGTRQVQLFQQLGSELPPVGRTLRIVQNEGAGNETAQYVRTTRVTPQQRTFIDDAGKPFQALVVTCEISDPLRLDFKGSPPSKYFERNRSLAAMIRDTSVADAATYYGASKVTQAIALGSLNARVESIFTQLVPSAQTEIPLTDFSAAGQSTALVESSSGTVSYTTTLPFNSTTVLSVGNAFMPGTLRIATAGGELVDEGGQLLAGITPIGTVSCARGEIRFAATAPAYSGAKTVTFRPAAAPLQLADTASIAVTQETRRYNYALTIVPAPAPGTVMVSYRSNGKWYDLFDDGGGILRGADSTYGTGTVSNITGTVLVTCGALPDAGSKIMVAWGSTARYINRSAITPPVPEVHIQLGHEGIAPESVTVAWDDGEDAHTATDDGHGGITGAAGGTLRYQTGLLILRPAKLPAGGQSYTVTYSYGTPDVETFPAPGGGGVVTIDLDRTDVLPNTVEVEWPAVYDRIVGSPPENVAQETSAGIITLRDNGAGVLMYGAVPVGTVDYAAGSLSFNPALCAISYQRPGYAAHTLTFYQPEFLGLGASEG